jgi:hypothetical protein
MKGITNKEGITNTEQGTRDASHEEDYPNIQYPISNIQYPISK